MPFRKRFLGQDELERDLQERIAFSFAGFDLSLAEAKDMARQYETAGYLRRIAG